MFLGHGHSKVLQHKLFLEREESYNFHTTCLAYTAIKGFILAMVLQYTFNRNSTRNYESHSFHMHLVPGRSSSVVVNESKVYYSQLSTTRKNVPHPKLDSIAKLWCLLYLMYVCTFYLAYFPLDM